MKPQVKMKNVVFLILVGFFLQDSSAVLHSLKYFYTGSSEVSNFPEFVAVGMVDDVKISYYDSNTMRAEPKQDWMNKVTGGDPQYWQTETADFLLHQSVFNYSIDILKQRFSQTGGVHVYQELVGCEWDDETDQFISGYRQIGYDGENFLVFDMETFTWVAPQLQAVVTKERWNNDKAFGAVYKNYFTKECPDWLKKYVEFGKSSLMRKDLPTVNLLQKAPSSRITCHATGFYPNQAALFWRKDGEELYDNVKYGETLPNHDGSFQMSVDLELPSDDWGKYECVFQLSGVEEDVVTKLDRKDIKTNYVEPMNPVPITVGVIIAVMAALALAIGGFLFNRKKNSKYDKASQTSSEVTEKLNPAPQC